MDRTEAFCEVLRSEGFVPRVDEEGDLIFKAEGRTYIIPIDPKDEQFTQVIYPNFWSLDSEEEKAAALAAASYANRTCKGAKVFLSSDEDDTIAAIEFFAPTAEQACVALPRSIRALQFAVRRFADKMSGDD